MIEHPFFAEVKEGERRENAQKRLVRFLRGNYNVSKDRSYSFYGIDGLELPRGTEKFRLIRTMVLVQKNEEF